MATTTVYALGRAVKQYLNAVESGTFEDVELEAKNVINTAEALCVAKGVLPEEDGV